MTSAQVPPRMTELIRPPKFDNVPDKLDKTAFTSYHPIIAVRVDVGKMATIRSNKDLRPWMLDMPRTRVVMDDPEGSSTKLIRLKVKSPDELPGNVREMLGREGRGFVEDTFEVGYDNWSASEILNSILPPDEDGGFAPSAFTQTGHIGHLNLRDEYLPHKHLIGQVFLDKNAGLRTIVNKLDTIHAEFRYFDMEVLAGDEDFITTCNESGCIFTFDFSKVYWNSRLQGEHDRLIDILQPGVVVVDVMAGVGPFAVPAAKKGCFVLGNDLNPESVKWMRENQMKNKVEKTLRVSEVDGKQFIKDSVRLVWDNPFPPWIAPGVLRKQQEAARKLRNELQKQREEGISTPVPSSTTSSTTLMPNAKQETLLEPQLPQHFIMNLPDSALTFLGAYRGLYTSMKDVPGFQAKLNQIGLPLVHCYCFTRELELQDAEKDICERASGYLGHPVTPTTDGYHLHLVRRVAPNKDMYCLTFRVPQEVAFATDNAAPAS